MLNHSVTMGRLVRDPELRHTQSGLPVCNFSIACERDYKDANGSKIVDYLNIIAWRKTGELAKQYLPKGRMVAIEGTLQIRTWVAHNGTKHKTAEIVADSIHFVDSRPREQNQAAPAPVPAAVGAYSSDSGGASFEEPF